jgi:hypothetical protein
MRLPNTTIVSLVRTAQGGLKVTSIRENPVVPSRDGRPVFGRFARRLLTVKEIASRDDLSLNKASEKRRSNPLACLADLPGQEPFDVLLQAA